MKRMLGLLTLICVLSAYAQVTKSGVLCDGVNKALQDSESNFVNLRGKFDWDLSEYAANVTFGGPDTCITESGSGVSSIKCTLRFQSEAEAQAAFQNYVSDTQSCFKAGTLRRRWNQPTSVSFSHMETSDDIRIRLITLPPRPNRPQPVYDVWLEITRIDPTVR